MRDGFADQTGNSVLRGSNLRRGKGLPESIAANGVQQASSQIHRMNIPSSSRARLEIIESRAEISGV